MPTEMTALQTRLGHRFARADLLTQALTHRSYSADNNERLEFLGDGILGSVIAEALYAHFPAATEGQMSAMRSRLVCNPMLVEQARHLALQGGMLLGGAERKPGRVRESILADAMEAILGAIYVDGGWAAAKTAILQLWRPHLAAISPTVAKDCKTQLQERLQKHRMPPPVYTIVAQSGPPHALLFTVQCALGEQALSTQASAPTRRAAEQAAAAKALAQLPAGV